MNEKEMKRLEKICKNKCFSKKMTYSDFILLLKHDTETRKLIREIVNTDDAESVELELNNPACLEKKELQSAPPISQKSLPIAHATDSLRSQLQPELALLAQIKKDAELTAFWLLNTDDSEGRQLIRLVATAAQWTRILELWDILAKRCKAEQRPVTSDERAILAGAIQIHNLIWNDKKAELKSVGVGGAFDFNQHERGISTGEMICAEWLPGLVNCGGELQKKPLVKTE